MSSNTPFEPAGQPEFLAQGGTPLQPRKGRTKLYVLAGVGVVAAGAVGVGAWGVAQLLGGGPGAAAVLPDTTLAYAAVDLDPSAGQKIEAIRTLKKFPALADELNLGTRDDMRKWLVDKLKQGDECDGLDYEDDIKPWIGEKGAVAALPNKDHVADVVFAVQVKDEGKAEDGLAKIFEACDQGGDYGVDFLDGYMIVAESDEVATGATAAAKKATLADDPDFTAAMDSIGDIGVVSLYLSKDGPKALYDATVGSFMGASDLCDPLAPLEGDDTVDDLSEMCEDMTGTGENQLDESLKNFKGAAATVRFDDGGIELAVSGKGVPSLDADNTAEPTTIGDLPGTTIGALGLSLPEGWVGNVEAQLKQALGEQLYDEGLAQAEAESALDLPEDIETLLGKGAVLALDGSTDFDSITSSEDPSGLKAGIRIEGDEADIRRIIDGLLRAAGGDDIVKVRAADGNVAVGFDDDYLDDLLAGGDLGGSETFRKAVAEADKANVALFVDFDTADNWLDRFVGDVSGGDEEAVANAKPLDALGASAWNDGDSAHFVVRLSTD